MFSWCSISSLYSSFEILGSCTRRNRCNIKIGSLPAAFEVGHRQIFLETESNCEQHTLKRYTPLICQLLKMVWLRPVICHCLVTETIGHNSEWDTCLSPGESRMMRVAICFKGLVSHYRKKKIPLCARKVRERESECVISLFVKSLTSASLL